MKAMVFKKISSFRESKTPLELVEIPVPEIHQNEILIKVSICGVCHTELDEIEGRTPPFQLPMIPGHQAVGNVVKLGKDAIQFQEGERAGVGWINSSCGECAYCKSGLENLCPDFRATGRDTNGGYAEYMKISENFAYRIPDKFTDAEAAPLLCAGAIGYRSLRITGLSNGKNLGLTGFGASGHLVMHLAKYVYPLSKIYVFARSENERKFALELGATWSGDTAEKPPELMDAIIDTTPVWKPVMEGLKFLKPGGRLVINAIRKEDIDKEALLQLDYPTQLWMEKEIKSVANVTRRDIREFLEFASRIPIKPEYEEYPLEDANKALVELKEKKIRGAKVLRISGKE